MAEKRKTRNFWISGNKGLDTNMIIITIFLIVFGLIMIYSASYYKCSMTKEFKYDSMYFLKKQAGMAVLGIAAMLTVSSINYHFWKQKWVVVLAGVLSVLLTLVLLTRGFGDKHPLNFSITANGATRWVKFGPISFQVAEAVKIAVIVITAWLISKRGTMEFKWKKFTWKHWRRTFVIAAPGIGLAVFLGIISNNMSSAIIIAIIGVLMYFAWHPKSAIFYGLGALGVVIGAVLILNLSNQMQEEKEKAQMQVIQEVQSADGGAQQVTPPVQNAESEEKEEGFRMGRIRAWLDPYSYQEDESFQSLQALYAIGSGGLIGKGLGNSIQKLGAIPEPYNDFIFAIVCEELGVMGASLLMLMFIYLLCRIFLIAQKAEDLFGRMLATGIFIHIALQVVLNIAVVTGSMPNTGVTLPFISYGGTATAFLLVEIGMALSVGKWSALRREERIRMKQLR